MDYDNMFSQDDSRYVSNNYIGYPNQGQNFNYDRMNDQSVNTVSSQAPIQQVNASSNQNLGQAQNQFQNYNSIGNSQFQSNNQMRNNQFQNQSASLFANQNVREELIPLSEAIELIKKSVGDEKEDEMFYDTLIKSAPNAKAVQIITSIRNDERRHNSILRSVYYRLTGVVLPSDNSIIDSSNMTKSSANPNTLNSNVANQNISNTANQSALASYKNNLVKALFGELDAVVKYRKIMGAMPDSATYTLIMSIMTDELRHASKYNYLIHDAH